MHRPKPIRGPETQLSKSRSGELYWEQAVSVPAPLNANELHLSKPTCLLHVPLRKTMLGWMHIYVSLWLAEMLSFNHTCLTQNWTQKESNSGRSDSQWLESLKGSIFTSSTAERWKDWQRWWWRKPKSEKETVAERKSRDSSLEPAFRCCRRLQLVIVWMMEAELDLLSGWWY